MSSKEKEREREIANRLLSWWGTAKRDYPWRRETNPYKVLIAELMLQRTKADQVMTVYLSFLDRYPTPNVLASAQLTTVKDFFGRLGLIWRAEKVKQLGITLATNFNGQVPETREELLSLPGVGEYVADAVLASAYDKNIAAVDSNVCRVVGRLFGIDARGEARRDPRFRKVAQRIVPKGRAKEFNWAMIDLASIVCTSKKPKCSICPLMGLCSYGTLEF